jgi:tetratricopeptide (TPR) repeat protein/predicted Ser/Thr protein kinase
MHGGIEIPGVELLDELGRGAHGAVYRARRGSEYYAVKVALAPSDPSAFVRFQREAIALARAKHPGLPRVLDVAKSGVPYLVMELVEGETLADRLTRGTLSEDETRALGLQLADVLAHIHRLGLVHRDVKPRNIIFDEKSGRARIVDFGIAIGTASTNVAAAEGTVPYAAPEQLRGLSVDGRADLYSLGCVLYECLCGTPPLGPLSLARLGKGDPTSDEARLERVNVSSELVRVIVRLASHEAKNRYVDAQELSDALCTSPFSGVSESAVRALVRSSSGALIGREREIALLQRAAAEVRGGTGRALVIEGAMGTGKTTLLQTFCEQLRLEGNVAIHISCASYDPVPFSVARRTFEAFLSSLGRERFVKTVEGFESILSAISPVLAAIFPKVPDVPHSDDLHYVILESAARCLNRLFELEPLTTLCVDDCQWLDEGSAAILRKLLGTARPAGLILLARRPGDAEGFDGFAGAQTLPVVKLSELDERAVRALVVAYLGGEGVSEEVVSRVTAFSAATPLGTLEAVRTLLDERALLPEWLGWRLQPEIAEGVHLSESVVETLRARIGNLEPLVPQVLLAAAVVGMDFDINDLPEISGLSQEEVACAVREAYRATLITGGAVRYRFVHQAVRDALLKACTEGKLRDLSGRAAEIVDRRLRAEGDRESDELVYRVADLYWRGEWRYTPDRAVEVIELAARRAFEAYDNRRALLFLEHAEEIRTALGMTPPGHTLHLKGEILVRLGNLASGRKLLECALANSRDRLERANILLRISGVYEWELDSARAWEAVRQAFKELGAEFPATSALSFSRSAGAWLRSTFGRVEVLPEEDVEGRTRKKILCALYYRTFRIGQLGANVPQTVQAAVLGLSAAQELGMSSSLSRAYFAYGFVLTAMGQFERGRSYLAQADDVARAVGDPVAVAHALQGRSVAACWEGKVGEGLEVGARCLLEHGHWLDFSEHCHLAYNQTLLERVRGRGYEELVWVEHLLKQVELNREAYGVFEFIELGAQSLMVHLGRTQDADRLLARLRQVTFKIPKESSYYVFSFGPRARALADAGHVGGPLDVLDTEFRHLNLDPRRVHLGAAEYYVHIAHARVHACLRAPSTPSPRELARLRTAASDLRLAARIPLLRAHSLVVDAYVAYFNRDEARAAKLFAEADALAIEEESPWVRYAVARGRAHCYRGIKSVDVVQSEARRAEEIARENGAVHRLRWIREEFGLSQTSSVFAQSSPNHASDVSRVGTSSRAGTTKDLRRARTRSRLQRAQEMVESEQARDVLLDELLVGIGASEIHAFWRLPNGQFEWWAGRTAQGPVETAPETSVVQAIANQKHWSIVDDTEVLQSRLLVPVAVRDDLPLLVYAEAPGCGVFDSEDCQLVAAAVETFLHRALTAPRGSSPHKEGLQLVPIHHSASEFAGALAEHMEELTGDGPASEGKLLTRMTALSRLLHETKRLEFYKPTLVNLNDVISRAVQRLRALTGDSLEILTALDPVLGPVYIDPEHVELVVLHCAMGARRRLGSSGVMAIETSSVSLEDAFAHEFKGYRPGLHAMLALSAVSDQVEFGGQDSTAAAPVNGFGDLAKQVARDVVVSNGAAFALRSDGSKGETLQILFPCAASSAPTKTLDDLTGTETILIVDRDLRLRQKVAGELKQLGYRVLLAEDPEGAASMVEVHGGVIEVAVIEAESSSSVNRTLAEVCVHTSYRSWSALRAAGVGIPKARFLQKPFAVSALARRIRRLLSSSPCAPVAHSSG